MFVSFYVTEWVAIKDHNDGGGEYRDKFLYSDGLDVLPVTGTNLHYSKIEAGNGMHKTKYRVVSVDWSVMKVDNNQTSNEVQVRMVKVLT